MDKHLNIVCLDTPWPADYGGAIDMMNRIRVFNQMGIRIHLHYFSYNERGTPNELNKFCESIHVYPREKMRAAQAFRLPYIVASRINQELIATLQQNEYPLLLEGVHCTGILPHIDIQHRKVVVRMHNDESIYYRELARVEKGIMKKLYFNTESRLLKKYMQQLPAQCTYACVSKEDAYIFRSEYGLSDSIFIPTFPSWQKVTAEEGQGNFCLYHGNLSVPENEKAALWLLTNVFTKTRTPFIIAGKKPSKRLLKHAELCQHTCLVADPSETEMNDLVRKAHINVLPCFNQKITGIRLKLLHALFEGRHCVVNEPMVAGTGLHEACHIASGANAFASVILQLYHQPYTREETVLRKELLGSTYDNERNARQLTQLLW